MLKAAAQLCSGEDGKVPLTPTSTLPLTLTLTLTLPPPLTLTLILSPKVSVTPRMQPVQLFNKAFEPAPELYP